MANPKSKKGAFIEMMASGKKGAGPSGKSVKKMLPGSKCKDCGMPMSKCEC